MGRAPSEGPETFRALPEGPGTFRKLHQTTIIHHNIVSQSPGTFRAVSEGHGTFREQHQTTGKETKMIEIMEIVENEFIWLEMS